MRVMIPEDARSLYHSQQFYLARGITINHLLELPPAFPRIIVHFPYSAILSISWFGFIWIINETPFNCHAPLFCRDSSILVLMAFFSFLSFCIILLSLRSSPTLLLTLWASSLNSSSGNPEAAISQTWFSAHNMKSDVYMNSSTACSVMIMPLQIERACCQSAGAYNSVI